MAFYRKIKISVMGILAILLIIAIFVSLTLGRYAIPLAQIITILMSKLLDLPVTCSKTMEMVLFNVRIPRIFAAILVGGALSVSGATYQGLFKNPMVSPDILGASAGAGFGAAIAILISLGSIGIQISAFLFGLGAVVISYTMSTIISRNNNAILVLVLTGMVVSTMFSSFTSMVKYVADPESKLPAITFWLMGGLSSISKNDIAVLLIPIVIGLVPLILLRWRLNVISFGDEEAQAMGIDTKKMRLLFIISSTLMTSAAVSVSGMVGWIGLIIPHIARLIVGPNYKAMLPASFLIGSTFLLFVDDIARNTFTVEIPLGILTSLIGAPFFFYLLAKGRKGWV
ncbi:FecCD family ABC transporter permease [Aceticella autotrophica]|uniref:FecCD family ABC transporter permease n=1 Tax=Aceticella autotrophica TaxID=2755338 RepID=UPI0025436BC8|nr:iron ABC transporter permease [Aceticella autotrophica]